jgi:hypothetical protein
MGGGFTQDTVSRDLRTPPISGLMGVARGSGLPAALQHTSPQCPQPSGRVGEAQGGPPRCARGEEGQSSTPPKLCRGQDGGEGTAVWPSVRGWRQRTSRARDAVGSLPRARGQAVGGRWWAEAGCGARGGRRRAAGPLSHPPPPARWRRRRRRLELP